MESLERSAIKTEQVYLCFNGLAIYLLVGRLCNPWFIQTLLKVNDVNQIDKQMSEEEIFQGYEHSAYLSAVYGLVSQFRCQRQPYCELRILVEGDIESEIILKTMLTVDNMNPTYNIDYAKFLASIVGSGSGLPTSGNIAGSTGTYYWIKN